MEQIFEQILGIKDIEVLSVKAYTDRYEISIRSKLSQGLCSKCGKKTNRVRSYYERRIKDLPISGKSVWLNLEVRQYECDCGNFFVEPFSFVRPKQGLTIRYEEYLYCRCKGADLQYISDKEELDWKTVNQIFLSFGQSELQGRRDWKKLTHLALDEIALRKGHKNYVVIVLDLLSGVILDILESRDKVFLINYFRGKGAEFCEQIEVFCSDMWKAYLNCAKEVFPNAVIVADRFHFYSKCQDGMDTARKVFRQNFSKDDDLKKLKWTLLKNLENLNDKELKKLNLVFDKQEYELLRLTWDARNEFRAILQKNINTRQAENLIEEWIEKVRKNKIRFLFRFVEFYQNWKTYILNYFKGRFSTGKLEGTNNKLKLIKRRAFGFLDFDHFRIRAMIESF